MSEDKKQQDTNPNQSLLVKLIRAHPKFAVSMTVIGGIYLGSWLTNPIKVSYRDLNSDRVPDLAIMSRVGKVHTFLGGYSDYTKPKSASKIKRQIESAENSGHPYKDIWDFYEARPYFRHLDRLPGNHLFPNEQTRRYIQREAVNSTFTEWGFYLHKK